MNAIFIFYFYVKASISDHVTLFSYLDFHLVSMETNKITNNTLFLRLLSLLSRRALTGVAC